MKRPSDQDSPQTMCQNKRSSNVLPRLKAPNPVNDDAGNQNKQRFIRQLNAVPISQDQLATEVKSIYSSLVTVEAECIKVDAAHAKDPTTLLGHEQWQNLIALHRTLLYEHNDFLMASQHPSANQGLRCLATKYSMPAGMWKHGIHAFLEVLRHRRPQSQDYMLAFIYLAYQMMALLLETVESFKDTWIECLGDLARYRMAIEEERESHTTWEGIATRWYTLANDRHPAIGRLNHHLGILERPSLRKVYFYAKALTCVTPFPNAKDSMMTMCEPILHDDEPMRSLNQPTEAKIMLFVAMTFSGQPEASTYPAHDKALDLFRQEPSTFTSRVGVALAVTNIAALFEFGRPDNQYRVVFARAISLSIQSSQPPTPSQACDSQVDRAPFNQPCTFPVPTALNFCFRSFDIALQQYHDLSALENAAPFVHVMLAWLHGLVSIRPWVVMDPEQVSAHRDIDGVLLHSLHMPWGSLAVYLNRLMAYYPLASRVTHCAKMRLFLQPESLDYQPLCEDFMVRGLVWTYLYFSRDWFDGKVDDDSRHIETSATRKMRAERILWLGLFLVEHTDQLHFDVERQTFIGGKGSLASPTGLAGTSQQPLVDATLSRVQVKKTYTDAENTINLIPGQIDRSPSSATLITSSSTSSSSSLESWTKVSFRHNRPGFQMPTNLESSPPSDEPSIGMR